VDLNRDRAPVNTEEPGSSNTMIRRFSGSRWKATGGRAIPLDRKVSAGESVKWGSGIAIASSKAMNDRRVPHVVFFQLFTKTRGGPKGGGKDWFVRQGRAKPSGRGEGGGQVSTGSRFLGFFVSHGIFPAGYQQPEGGNRGTGWRAETAVADYSAHRSVVSVGRARGIPFSPLLLLAAVCGRAATAIREKCCCWCRRRPTDAYSTSLACVLTGWSAVHVYGPPFSPA